MNRADDDSPVATAEHMLLHVDAHLGKASPASPEILATLAEVAAHHDKLPRPVQAGRSIGQPKP
jgi:carnitine 3-dehydrogenase